MKRDAAPWAARPRSVLAAVRAARAGLCAARALEALLLFAAGTLVTASAALLSQATGREAAAVAWLGGALCAAAWWGEHALGLAATARALDRELGADGALATAFELEQRRTALRPLEELLRERVLAPLRLAPLWRALRPSFLVPLGAPLAAGVLFALVLDARDAAPTDERAALLPGLERALDAAELELARTAPLAESQAASAALARLRAALPLAGASGAAPEARAAAAQAGAELERRLAALGAALEPGSERSALEQARPWLDALRTGLAPASRPSGSGPPLDGPLTRGPAQGTISGSNPEPNPLAEPMTNDRTTAAAEATASEALATQQGTWWPAEYDAVVERWLALSRAAHEGEAR